MYATGLVRRIDDLGRIVIPMEIRRRLGIAQYQPMEILVDDKGGIVLQPYRRGCFKCGTTEDLHEIGDNFTLCTKCAQAVAASDPKEKAGDPS